MTVEEPVLAPPWREEDGPGPVMWVWPDGAQPALRVKLEDRWTVAPVTARADYADGRVAYHVVVTLPPPSEGGAHRAYWWPSPRLRVAWGSAVEPVRAG